LFANSPFREGRANGFLSYRSHIWTDVDNARAGMLPFVFEDGFGFEHYVDYALDVPMYFVYRNGRYIDVSGKSFRDFLAGRISELKGIEPTMADWADHLTTIFPEARMKQFLEMRGADGGTWRRICGLPALWVGIFYDQSALDAAWDMVKDWTTEERQAMRDAVPRLAFNTPFRGRNLGDLALQMLDISAEGLRRRASHDAIGTTEEGFLAPLRDLIERGYTRAEQLLRQYEGEWNRDFARLFSEYNFL
jgi:glutamate--cysteine ligase